MDQRARDGNDDIEQILDAARTSTDAVARERRRVLADATAEAATVRGTLLDLAETQAPIAVVMRSDRRHAGRLDALGSDFLRLALDDGRVLFARLDAIAGFVPHGHGGRRAAGERPSPTDLTLVELLRMRVPDRPECVLWRGMAPAAAGTLVAVGVDIITVRTDHGVEHLVADAVTEVATRDVR